MITKKTLLAYINDLDEGFFALINRVQTLENEVEKLKKKTAPKTGGEEQKPKRGRGRPRKSEQPRDENGKFAKKK